LGVGSSGVGFGGWGADGFPSIESPIIPCLNLNLNLNPDPAIKIKIKIKIKIRIKIKIITQSPAMELPRILSSVRAMMALVLAFGCGLGWFVHRAQVQRDAVAAILRAGGRVSYDWQWNNGRWIAKGKPRWPGWLVDRLGSDYVANVTRI